jgi:hypothetical protein
MMNSFNHSYTEMREVINDPFDPKGEINQIQYWTAVVALGSLVISAIAFASVGLAYLEDKFYRLISFNMLTTLRAFLILNLTPYLLTAGKVTLLIGAAATALWAVETIIRACVNMHDDYRQRS